MLNNKTLTGLAAIACALCVGLIMTCGEAVAAEEIFDKVSAGGRVQYDIGGPVSSDTAIGAVNGFYKFRRIYLTSSGRMYKLFNYKVEFDIAGAALTLYDNFVDLQGIPYIGTLRLGHFCELFSLEDYTSNKYVTFIERALPNIFAPGRNAGLGFMNYSPEMNMTWGLGIFKNAGTAADALGDESLHITGRLTKLLWNRNEGKSYLHLGLAYSYQSSGAVTVFKYEVRPELYVTNKFLSSGIIAGVKGVNLTGLEAAWVCGPLALQGEYMLNSVTANSKTEALTGYYAYASYFLSGESRAYSGAEGCFGRVKPKQNFVLKGEGAGAFEVALRYSGLNFNGTTLNKGELGNVTLGFNWYLNPYLREMFNVVYSDIKNTGSALFVVARTSFDF